MPQFLRQFPGQSIRLSRIALYLGLALALCVYYLNYTVSFNEGQIEVTSPFTTVIRLLSIGLISASLIPFKRKYGTLWLLVLLYMVAAASYFLSVASYGSANDALFINTLIQLPVLIALSATVHDVDYCHWFKFIGFVLALQVIGDVIIGFRGDALWLSGAFIGGVGNPSSFGFLCCLLMAFYLLYPKIGPARWLFVAVLSFGTVRSESLFSVLGLVIVFVYWMFQNGKRFILSCLIIGASLVGIKAGGIDTADGKLAFIEHKIYAASALLGLMDYDIQSSESVSLRVKIHYQTLRAIADDPLRLIYGHLGTKTYWPMDSQILTYLGSFGLIILLAFLVLHISWARQAFLKKKIDHGFAFVALVLFGLIFLTNRILDYFPVAIVYFILISMAMKSNNKLTVLNNNSASVI